MISSPYAVFTFSSVQSMLPSAIRNQAIDIADACDFELTYAHLLTSEERFVRSVWKETTPTELVDAGVVVVDPDDLE